MLDGEWTVRMAGDQPVIEREGRAIALPWGEDRIEITYLMAASKKMREASREVLFVLRPNSEQTWEGQLSKSVAEALAAAKPPAVKGASQ